MDSKNVIINNYAHFLYEAAVSVVNTSANLNNNHDENISVIKTLDVLLNSVRAQTVLMQDAIDKYSESK